MILWFYDTAKLKGYETYLSYSIMEGVKVSKLPGLEKSTAVAGNWNG